MRTPKRSATSLEMLASIFKLTLGVTMGLAASCSVDDGRAGDPATNDDSITETGEDASSASVCTSGPFRCLSHVRTTGAGVNRRLTSHAATPTGIGATDLQSAYKIDPTKLATSTKPTIAIIDAYGYTNLEADLAVYRSQYGLPACTKANGCLKIVNQDGQASPLPPNPPADDDWTVETALDVDMASAGCPLCNILVVQATDNAGDGLFIAQNAAIALGATVISNSWGGPEQAGQPLAPAEAYFNHPNVGIYVAAGDAGYNNTIVPAGNVTGPDYPGTSQYTIAVGATRLVKDATTTRGWTETAWAVTNTAGAVDLTRGAGGSACSLSTVKPAYQTASPCAFKATADVSAVGDPATGLAVYNTTVANRAWISVGGTSASAPFVAAIMAATGNGKQTSGEFFSLNTAKLWDVTSGTNGACVGKTLLCNAATGWDGPTGFGTPNVSALMAAATGAGNGGGTGAGGGTGNGGGGTDGKGTVGTTGTGSGSQDLQGGCAVGGSGSGLLLGLALLGLRRRRR